MQLNEHSYSLTVFGAARLLPMQAIVLMAPSYGSYITAWHPTGEFLPAKPARILQELNPPKPEVDPSIGLCKTDQ